MSVFPQVASMALRGAAQAAGVGSVAGTVSAVEGFLRDRFSDHSAVLTDALRASVASAWSAVEISLAGSSWWDRAKAALATADDRAVKSQIDAFLAAHPHDGIDGHGPDFRRQCLIQLREARRLGMLDRGDADPAQLARNVGDLSRFGDPDAVVRAEFRLLDEVVARLRSYGHGALATFLMLRPASGPPLLVSSVRFFFQRHVERKPELFQGLAYARLDALAEGQRAGFGELSQALDALGSRLETMLAGVHADVLDVKAELARQGAQLRELGEAVLDALRARQMDRRELRPADSLSIRDESERRLVRDLVRRYRALPAGERRAMPALLNAVGKLEAAGGDFDAAQADFRELASMVTDAAARGEAAFNAYRVALERRDWGAALESLRVAVASDGPRYAPFPSEKYEVESILGAGGFGVAMLCRNRHSGARVVVKGLFRDVLDRDVTDVFREAQALEDLDHPAIIRVRDCDFADPGRARPYIVMDFFDGRGLDDHVKTNGALAAADLLPLAKLLAAGMEKAHSRRILHRDLKPANVLVRRERDRWHAKIIDFGLAMRSADKLSTNRASLDRTLAGASLAGTIDFAAPEQMGRLRETPVGTYSDVYGFGKTCCFALFGTPSPTYQDWQSLPPKLADLLGRCIAEQPPRRPQTFTDVLRELDSIGRAEMPKPAPKPKPEPVLEAMPVVEVLPVVETREPVRNTRRERGERREERRETPRREPAPAGRSAGAMFGCLLVALGVGAAALGAGYLFLRPSGKDDRFRPSLTWRPVTSYTETVKPLAPEEIDAARKTLDESQDGKLIAATLARFAATKPTEKQLAARQARKNADDLFAKKAGITAKARAEAVAADEIGRVSEALNTPLRHPDNGINAEAAKACMNWGTSANVADLSAVLAKMSIPGREGGLDGRVTVCKALGKIGDPRGAKVVASRLGDAWDGPRGIVEALKSFGPVAEDDVLDQLGDPWARGRAIEVLGDIGTKKSLDRLAKEAAAPDRAAVNAAVAKIRARPKA